MEPMCHLKKYGFEDQVKGTGLIRASLSSQNFMHYNNVYG